MQITPLVSFSLTVIGFGLLAWPLSLLTAESGSRSVSNSSEERVSNPNELKNCRLSLKVSQKPENLEIKIGERVLMKFSGVETQEAKFDFPLVDGSVELIVSGKWKEEEGNIALSLILEPENQDAQIRTLWTDYGQIEDVVVFDISSGKGK